MAHMASAFEDEVAVTSQEHEPRQGLQSSSDFKRPSSGNLQQGERRSWQKVAKAKVLHRDLELSPN